VATTKINEMRKVIAAVSPPPIIYNAAEARRQEMYQMLKGKPFYIFDKAQHRAEARRVGGPRCCFNHLVGLPELNGVQHPLYDYQQLIFDKLQSEGKKYLWIKKATGLGISEFFLRYIAWLCTKDDAMRGKRICIITGIRIETAVDHMNRLRALFFKNLDVTFDSKRTVLELNGCTIECFPAEHTDTLRSLVDIRFLLIDEADFFPPQQAQNIRDVAERLIPKTGGEVRIVFVSTPNRPDGLFSKMEVENPSIYDKIFLDWRCGYGKVYSPESIAVARTSPSWGREYELKYHGSAFGNVLLPSTVDAAIELGKEYDPTDEAEIKNPFVLRCIGVDPAWGGSSKFAIVLTQVKTRQYPHGERDVIEVMVAEQHERANFSDMVSRVTDIFRTFNGFRHDVRSLDFPVFVDQSAAGFLSSLRQAVGLEPRYDLLVEKARKAGFTQPRQIQSILGCIQPKLFTHTENAKMLSGLKQLFDQEMVAVNEKFFDLITALRSAYSSDGDTLDKQHSYGNDLIDALMISLSWWKLKKAA